MMGGLLNGLGNDLYYASIDGANVIATVSAQMTNLNHAGKVQAIKDATDKSANIGTFLSNTTPNGIQIYQNTKNSK